MLGHLSFSDTISALDVLVAVFSVTRELKKNLLMAAKHGDRAVRCGTTIKRREEHGVRRNSV